MQKSKVINEFKGHYERLSNFYPVVVHYEGMNFPSVEHAFVASKSNDHMFRYKISQLAPDKAGKAKRMGRQIKLRENWDMIKLSVMKNLLIQKFSYPDFRQFLLSTGDAILIEGNHWHDNYWGDCYCEECENIIGHNNLGKILMKVRDLIK